MNNLNYFIFTALIILLLAGCKQNTPPLNSELLQSEQKILADSLHILDSLVSKNEIQHFSVALKFAQRSLIIAKRLNTNESFAKSYLILGNIYFTSKMDSGFYFYNKALTLINSFHLEKERGNVMYDLGMLHGAAGNYKTSIIFLDSALVCSRAVHDFVTASNALNSLGNIYFDMGDDSSARKLYDSAFIMARSKSLYLQMGSALGNLAKFETNKKKSIELNKEAVSYLRKSNDSEDPIASTLINIGLCFDNPDSAIHYFQQALHLVNSDKSSDAFLGAYNNMAYSYLDKGDLINAEKCIAEHALPASIESHNLDWQSTIYDTYSDVMKRKGNLSKALEYEKKSIEILGAANRQSAFKQIRLLASMLDLKNKETTIKDDKIEIEETRSHLRNRNQWIGIIILFVFALVSIFFLWMQKKRIQLQHQQIASAKKIIEAEETEKAKIGRDLHDLTGQMFTGLSGHIENTEFPDPQSKHTTLKIVKEIRETVRELSHRMNISWLERFTLEKTIRGLCEDMKKMTHLNLEYNAPDEFPLMPMETKIHIFRIVQELLSNAVKYAADAKIILEISFVDSTFTLEYSDDGPGFIKDKDFRNGVGLSNLSERIKLVNGKMETDTNPGFGTYYLIKIPLPKDKIAD